MILPDHLSLDARQILKKMQELGFVRAGEAIQARTYVVLFDNRDRAFAAANELQQAGIAEVTRDRSIKLKKDLGHTRI